VGEGTSGVNLNTWPATLFVARDGRVRSIHTGFAAPSSGTFNDQLKTEFTAQIEKLLAENETQAAQAKPEVGAPTTAQLHAANY